MLYDPKWEIETKADPLALESLIAWLEKQPGNHTYCYSNTGDCLLHRYLTAMGLELAGVGGVCFSLKLAPTSYLPLSIEFQDIAVQHPHTFGGALKRARAAQSAAR